MGNGSVMHDSKGATILVKGRSMDISDANHVETIGLLEVLRMIKKWSFTNCFVEEAKTVLN